MSVFAFEVSLANELADLLIPIGRTGILSLILQPKDELLITVLLRRVSEDYLIPWLLVDDKDLDP